MRQKRYRKAVDAVESAAEDTWHTYVESIKEGRSDGRLLPGEKRRARQLARERAVAVGRDRGVDILRELGNDHLEVLTTRAPEPASGAVGECGTRGLTGRKVP